MTAPSSKTIERYESMVRAIAFRLLRQLRLRVDVEDLVQLGMIGLLEAEQRWDPEQGSDLGKFAYYRVRGAMLDGIGGLTGVSRGAVRNARRAAAAAGYAEALAESTDPQYAEAADYVSRAIQGVLFVTEFSDLCEATSSADVDAESELARPADERVSRAQLAALIPRLLADLPEQEAFFLRGHYLEGRSLKDLGEDLGVSRSWACRLHAKAIARAREILRETYKIDDDLFFGAT